MFKTSLGNMVRPVSNGKVSTKLGRRDGVCVGVKFTVGCLLAYKRPWVQFLGLEIKKKKVSYSA